MVPINVRYTPREVAYVLDDSGARMLVTEADILEEIRSAPELAGFAALDNPVVVGEASSGHSWAALSQTAADDFRPSREPTLDDLINIQYTSGTTGFPKGCMLSHRYWLTLSRVAAMRANGVVRNVLAAQPFYYMDPQWLLLMAMRLRGTLFVAAKASGTNLLEWIRKYGIEYCIFPQIVLKQPPRPVFLDRNDRINQIISPFLTSLNSMPRIALGPLFILWFGIGMASKIALAFSLGYFIMLLSTLGGLKNVDRDLLLMSRLFGASDLRLFRDVRIPWALPSIFAGLRLTLIYCSAGAVIGEMIAAKSGLGLLVQTASGRFDVAGVMALILIVAAMVMIFTALMNLFEERLLVWSKGSTDVPG